MQTQYGRRAALNARALGMVAAAAGGVLLCQDVRATETQTFDTAASAAAAGWAAGGAPSYGFQASNNTGQTPAGEAGGIFPRSDTRSSYGDTTLGGLVTQAMPITAAGELNIRNSAFADGEHLIGHYNTAGVTENTQTNILGILILEGNPGPEANFRYQPFIRDSSGLEFSDGNGRINLPYLNNEGQPILYKFDYTWDPAASSLTTRILDTAGVPVPGGLNVLDLETSPTFSFDAFGLSSGFNGSSEPKNHEIYIDNVTYTTGGGGGGLAGDFNADAVVNATDIDLLCDRINAGTGPVSPFDVNGDNSVNQADVNFEVTNILHTKFGDTDTDGDVDLNDLGNLASGFNMPGEKRWSRGNFDCDQDVDLPDLGTLATNFGAGRAAAYAAFEALVPEPAAVGTLIFALVPAMRRRRR
jgi:hypothetical protein